MALLPQPICMALLSGQVLNWLHRRSSDWEVLLAHAPQSSHTGPNHVIHIFNDIVKLVTLVAYLYIVFLYFMHCKWRRRHRHLTKWPNFFDLIIRCARDYFFLLSFLWFEFSMSLGAIFLFIFLMTLTFPHRRKRISAVWDLVRRCPVRGSFSPPHTFVGIDVLLRSRVSVCGLGRRSADHPEGEWIEGRN